MQQELFIAPWSLKSRRETYCSLSPTKQTVNCAEQGESVAKHSALGTEPNLVGWASGFFLQCPLHCCMAHNYPGLPSPQKDPYIVLLAVSAYKKFTPQLPSHCPASEGPASLLASSDSLTGNPKKHRKRDLRIFKQCFP